MSSPVAFVRLFSFVLATMLMGAQAMASYIKVPYNRASIDVAQRTHFIVVSKGNDLGFAPQLSALTKAAKLADVYPNDQIVLFIPEETDGNLKWLKQSGQTGAERVDILLDTKKLFDELEVFSKIVSIHTYGHSAIPEGVFLDAVGKRDIRWYPQVSHPKRVVGHFTEDAFVTLNGCNLGHSMAPMLSRLWHIPVAGALVGTHFEVLMPNGRFEILGSAEAKWAKTSLGVFSKDGACVRGCVRMRPDNAPYNGHYGKYPQGLGIYKFFCGDLSEADCQKGMARSMITSVTATAALPTGTRDQFAAATREWLCATGSSSKFQDECFARLNEVESTLASNAIPSFTERLYTPFKGASHQCDSQGCYENRSCLVLSKTWDCAQRERPPVRSTTFVDEYTHYMQGFELLKAERSQP